MLVIIGYVVVVACVFGGSPSDPDYAPRPVRPGGALPAKALPASACPAPRLPGDMTGRLPGRHLLLAS